MMNTLVEVFAIEATSKPASRIETATYFATEPKPGTAVGDRQIVVDGLRHVDRLDRDAARVRELRDLQARVGRVAAAVVEEVADVVRLEHLDQPLVLRRVVLELLQLVARRAERARRRMAQGADRRRGFLAGVDQVFGQGADDAVPACIHLGDTVLVLAAGLDDAAGGGVDDGGDAAGLGVEGVAGLGGHSCSFVDGHGGKPCVTGRFARGGRRAKDTQPRPSFL